MGFKILAQRAAVWNQIIHTSLYNWIKLKINLPNYQVDIILRVVNNSSLM